MKKVLIVFPISWDMKQLEHCQNEWASIYQIEYAEPSHENCGWDFDVLSFLNKLTPVKKNKIDGVFSTSDYLGMIAASIIAKALNLPGSSPEAIIKSSHKYYSRLFQQIAAPEATPKFDLLIAQKSIPKLTKINFPCFVKPVKGSYSVLSQRINDLETLSRFLKSPDVIRYTSHYLTRYNQCLNHFTNLEIDGNYFIVEELLDGMQITIEGYCHRERIEMLGIVDTVKHPHSDSFARFDYPSILNQDIQKRMKMIARKVIKASSLKNTFFNIEMIYNKETDSIYILEINPRLCGQFSDLYEKVDGINSYLIALALAANNPIPCYKKKRGQFNMASSFPLRVFQPVKVMSAPNKQTIQKIEQDFPGTLIWNECEKNEILDPHHLLEDGQSCRYGVVNLGARSKEEMMQKFNKIFQRLGFHFEPHCSDYLP